MPGYGELGTYGSLVYKQELEAATLTNNKINATTGVCIGYGVNDEHGQGYSFLLNRTVPTAWIWPDPMSDPLTILDENNNKRCLVLDEITGHWYEIGTRNGPTNSGLVAAFQDKMSDQYAGAEIPCGLKLREHIGKAEHEFVEHIETHGYLRPQDEANKGLSGYTLLGMRQAFELEYRAYVNGNLTESARTKNVPLGGDAVFDRNVKDHRVQIGFFTTTSEFKLAGLDQYYLLHDEAAVNKAMSEHGWQTEFGNPFLWVTRGPNPMLNRATNTNLTGSYFSVVDGPDNVDGSAMNFGPGNGFVGPVERLNDNFTFIISAKDLDLPCRVLGPVYVFDLHNTKYIQISVNGHNVSCPLTWNGKGWVTLMVKRTGDDIVFGEDGQIKGTFPINIGTINQSIDIMNGEEGKVFTAWGFDCAISDKAWEYYYNDIIENQGNAILPAW